MRSPEGCKPPSDSEGTSKETNRLEEVEQGLVHDWEQVQSVF